MTKQFFFLNYLFCNQKQDNLKTRITYMYIPTKGAFFCTAVHVLTAINSEKLMGTSVLVVMSVVW